MLIERTVPSCLIIKDHILYPGINMIPESMEKVIADHPMVKAQLELGHLKVVGVSPKEKQALPVDVHDALAAEVLSIKTVKKAVDIVSKILSANTLKIVLEQETRKQVLDAARKRYDEVKLPPPDKKDETVV